MKGGGARRKQKCASGPPGVKVTFPSGAFSKAHNTRQTHSETTVSIALFATAAARREGETHTAIPISPCNSLSFSYHLPAP